VLALLLFIVAAGAIFVTGGAWAQVPLPPPRPAIEKAPTRAMPPRGAKRLPRNELPPAEGSPCTDLLADGIAIVELRTSVSGASGEALCGDLAPVRLSAVRLPDGRTVELRPAALVRCEMAHTFARWVRDDLVAALTPYEGYLQRLEIAASYTCRPRNNVSGARLSEHGLANAIDIAAIVLSAGGRIGISEPVRPAILFSEMKRSACARFTTVLGPGADAAHEHHLHVDLAHRRGGYRICQWNQADDPNP
jgi:hypothetical protein